MLAGLWFVNLVNFMDGLDWMTVAEVVPINGKPWSCSDKPMRLPADGSLVAAALGGAILGFAYFNRPIASVFLGDVGSLPIGLLLGWLLLQVAANQHLIAAIVVAALLSCRRNDHAVTPARTRRRAGLAGASHALLSAGDRSRLYDH